MEDDRAPVITKLVLRTHDVIAIEFDHVVEHDLGVCLLAHERQERLHPELFASLEQDRIAPLESFLQAVQRIIHATCPDIWQRVIVAQSKTQHPTLRQKCRIA